MNTPSTIALTEMLEAWGVSSIKEMSAILGRSKFSRSSSGGTLQGSAIQKAVESLPVKVKESKGRFLLEFALPFYAVYINDGRKAGSKMPPESAILTWMRRKGIPKEKSYPIRKGIAERGMNETKFMDKGFWGYTSVFERQIEQNFGDKVLDEIINYARANGYGSNTKANA